jgi:hypothetical protein
VLFNSAHNAGVVVVDDTAARQYLFGRKQWQFGRLTENIAVAFSGRLTKPQPPQQRWAPGHVFGRQTSITSCRGGFTTTTDRVHLEHHSRLRR